MGRLGACSHCPAILTAAVPPIGPLLGAAEGSSCQLGQDKAHPCIGTIARLLLPAADKGLLKPLNHTSPANPCVGPPRSRGAQARGRRPPEHCSTHRMLRSPEPPVGAWAADRAGEVLSCEPRRSPLLPRPPVQLALGITQPFISCVLMLWHLGPHWPRRGAPC